jgi:hypothetical protein
MSVGYRTASHVVTRQVAGERLLVPLRGSIADLRRIHVLNEVGEFVWLRLDGAHDVSRLVAEVTQAFHVPSAQAEQDIVAFLDELRSQGLVEWPAPTERS